MAFWEFIGLRFSRLVRKEDTEEFLNKEGIPLLNQIRKALQSLPLWGVIPWGDNESDIPLMTRVDGALEPAWSTPRARVLHLTASELVAGLLDYRLASRIHLYLDQDAALTVTLPTLTARDVPNGITGSSAHCTLRITNAGGFNVTSWPSNVKFKGTAPTLTSMTAGQRWYFSLYADGTDAVIDCINSGPMG